MTAFQRGSELYGRHHPQTRFPLLLKFLDAQRNLSVQVHPDDARAYRILGTIAKAEVKPIMALTVQRPFGRSYPLSLD